MSQGYSRFGLRQMKLSVGVGVAGLATRIVVLVVSAWVSLCRKSGADNFPGASKKLWKR